jgi:hypothetical protein
VHGLQLPCIPSLWVKLLVQVSAWLLGVRHVDRNAWMYHTISRMLPSHGCTGQVCECGSNAEHAPGQSAFRMLLAMQSRGAQAYNFLTPSPEWA